MALLSIGWKKGVHDSRIQGPVFMFGTDDQKNLQRVRNKGPANPVTGIKISDFF
jgi:hypothetical protein